jgi:2-hydroxychromene-2-carboxylate isomerase
MRGAIAARRSGIFESYIDEIYRNMWAEPKKMDDPNVFRTVLTDAGFDAESILRLIETREIKDELLQNTERSVERGTFGSPTFYVGNEIFFGKDRLREVEEEILHLQAQS